MRIGGSKSQSGHCGKNKNLLLMYGVEPQTPSPESIVKPIGLTWLGNIKYDLEIIYSNRQLKIMFYRMKISNMAGDYVFWHVGSNGLITVLYYTDS
jgi:hypothetical protein